MSDDLDTRNPDSLERHPLNEEIYGEEELEKEFLRSVEQQGIIQPIVIRDDDVVVSGHRRMEAAQEAELDEVPVRIVDFESELEEREAVVHSNKQRDKIFSQKMREAEELMEIERQRAKQREREGGAKGGSKGTQNLADPSKGETRQKVARVYDWSRETLRKAQYVWEKAQEGHDELQSVAKEQVQKLDNESTSIHAAYETVQEWEERFERKEPVRPKEMKEGGQPAVSYKRIYEQISPTLDEDENWTELLHSVYMNWPQEKIEAETLAFSIAYFLEEDGFASFSGELTNPESPEPESFTERCPDADTLEELYWEDEQSLLELAVRFSVPRDLVALWMYEQEVDIRKEDLRDDVRQQVEFKRENTAIRQAGSRGDFDVEKGEEQLSKQELNEADRAFVDDEEYTEMSEFVDDEPVAEAEPAEEDD